MKFTNIEGKKIVENIIHIIQENRDELSRIDGLIGDGDHGINMNKGVSMAQDELAKKSYTMSEGFQTISLILMNKIGGSMGPLYGSFFRGLYTSSKDYEVIDGEVILSMLQKAYANIKLISVARVDDKTLIDVLDPAIKAYESKYEATRDVSQALNAMLEAGWNGLEHTKKLVAKVGRASRLKERSLGFQDAGATSCYLILKAFKETSIELISQ